MASFAAADVLVQIARREERRASEFNDSHPVGSEIMVEMPNGEVVKGHTAAPAFVFEGCMAAVHLRDRAAPYPLSKIREAR